MKTNLVFQENSIRTMLINRMKTGRAGLAAYLTLGYPDLNTSIAAMVGLAKVGVDVIEIGIPFSDPIADGPIIQHSNNIALKNGIKVSDAWKAANKIRNETKAIPLVMTYANIPMQYDYSKFSNDAYNAGIRGIILPDVPLNHFPKELLKLQPIFLVSPLTSQIRLERLVKNTNGFLYIVSNLGITGEINKIDARITKIVNYVNSINPQLPKMLGFGINNNKSARKAIEHGLDGVIVGSAFIKTLGDKGDIDNLLELANNIISSLHQ